MPNAASDDETTPVHIDTTKASIARVYDACLGGKDNYEVDREVFHRVRRVAPEVHQLAWDNRQFLTRVTRYIATETGVRQFLDCGSGLPTAENTHQVAQRLQPSARVVYVDNDPVVLAHGRALLKENNQTHFSPADVFEPRELLDDEVVREHLDFTEPIALFQMSTLHHYDGKRPVSDIMREYVEALPRGSYVAISHFLDPENELSDLARRMEQTLLHSPLGTGLFRTHAEIEAMFPGLELIHPGLVRCADWWPDGPRLKALDDVQYCVAGAVGRKP